MVRSTRVYLKILSNIERERERERNRQGNMEHQWMLVYLYGCWKISGRRRYFRRIHLTESNDIKVLHVGKSNVDFTSFLDYYLFHSIFCLLKCKLLPIIEEVSNVNNVAVWIRNAFTYGNFVDVIFSWVSMCRLGNWSYFSNLFMIYSSGTQIRTKLKQKFSIHKFHVKYSVAWAINW